MRHQLSARLLACLLVAASALVATSVDAQGPDGFVDGTWQGVLVWEATATFSEAVGTGEASGGFTVTYTGGSPEGAFSFVAPNATGETADATAILDFIADGTVTGTATEPVLTPASGLVAGNVHVKDYGIVPVEFALGPGDLSAMPLDITAAGCTATSGNFSTAIANTAAAVGSAGGTLVVQRAFWSAIRVGGDGAASSDQIAALNELVTDAMAMAVAIETGAYDASELRALLRRAAEFDTSIPRNASCGIATPGHASSVIAGVITALLARMVDYSDLFDVQQFFSAIVAAVQSGALGSNAGPAGQALAIDLQNMLGSKLVDAVADGNKQDLLTIHVAAMALGDDALAAEALAEANKL